MILFRLWQVSTYCDFLYQDRLFGNILMRSGKTGLHFRDRINDAHSVDDLTENGIPETLGRRRREIKKRVIDEIDEKLARRGIDNHRARHGDGATLVLKAVHRLVADRLTSRLLIHGLRKAAALNHEPVDDAMENRTVIMAVFGKVTDGMSVVDAIAKVKTGFAGPHQNVPDVAIVIKKVAISE